MNAQGTAEWLSRATPQATTYRALVARGLEPQEAANLIAIGAGIPIVGEPWTLREVSHLRFLQWLCDTGRFGPNDGGR